MSALDFEIFLNFLPFQRCEVLSRSAICETTCTYSICGDNNLVPLCLWRWETTPKDKIATKYFGRVCLEDLFLLPYFKESTKTPKMFFPWKKNIEFFHKYCPTSFSCVICAIFVPERKVQNSTWKMPNVAIFHIAVSLNINFYKIKSSRDTNIFRKFKLQRVWTELKSEFCFLRYSFTK